MYDLIFNLTEANNLISIDVYCVLNKEQKTNILISETTFLDTIFDLDLVDYIQRFC